MTNIKSNKIYDIINSSKFYLEISIFFMKKYKSSLGLYVYYYHCNGLIMKNK